MKLEAKWRNLIPWTQLLHYSKSLRAARFNRLPSGLPSRLHSLQDSSPQLLARRRHSIMCVDNTDNSRRRPHPCLFCNSIQSGFQPLVPANRQLGDNSFVYFLFYKFNELVLVAWRWRCGVLKRVINFRRLPWHLYTPQDSPPIVVVT